MSSYVLYTGGRHDQGVGERVRNLRAPISFTIAGQEVELVTIGHVAHALGRGTWTIRYWQRIGLFPDTPFFLYPAIPKFCRHLFPAQFVEQLAVIPGLDYWGPRLEHDQWQRFQQDVWRAYEETVLPLMDGVERDGPLKTP